MATLNKSVKAEAPELLTRAEAAQYLSVSVSWLANRSSDPAGPKITYVGTRSVRYLKADLNAWLHANQQAVRERRAAAGVEDRVTRRVKKVEPVKEFTEDTVVRHLRAALEAAEKKAAGK